MNNAPCSYSGLVFAMHSKGPWNSVDVCMYNASDSSYDPLKVGSCLSQNSPLTISLSSPSINSFSDILCELFKEAVVNFPRVFEILIQISFVLF